MFDNIKDIYTAKLELAKLEGVDSVSNLLAKTLSIVIQILAATVSFITVLILCAIALGYLLDNYMVGIIIFCGVLIVLSLGAIFFRDQIIEKPIKNLLIKSFYES
jgi:hypothetical protein